MVGHSLGGASAIAAMRVDPRIRAGINMDGSIHVQPNGLDRPFLLLGTADHQPGGRDDTWDQAWSGLTGWRRWLTVADTRVYVAAFVDRHLRGRPAPAVAALPAVTDARR